MEWRQLDVTSFLDQVTGFLGEHGQLDGHSTSPPQKRSRSVSIILYDGWGRCIEYIFVSIVKKQFIF